MADPADRSPPAGHRGPPGVRPDQPRQYLEERRLSGAVRSEDGERLSRLEAERDIVERSEEHTSELQSRGHLVCRLLLAKKKGTRKRSCSWSTWRGAVPRSSP